MAGGCVFCAIVAGDAPATVLYEDDRTVAFMDIAPIARGHCLVVPRRHARDWLDVDPDDAAAMARTSQIVGRAAVEGLSADGLNLLQATGAIAFQTVFHVHLHVLPRFASDDIRLPFTKRGSSPEDIAAAADAISAALRASPSSGGT